jgi:hypothetical protein
MDITNFTVYDTVSQLIAGDGPYLPLSGGTMSGAILQPLLPTTNNELTNKNYVDSQISNIPDATPLVKGKIQLAGDLTGTASFPTVSLFAITNSKLSNMTATSQLKGSSQFSSTVTDISLGTGLSMTGSTLNATGVAVPTAGNTQFGVVEFNAAGDLTETSLNSGIAVVKALAITNSKLSDMTAVSQLKGSSSSSSAVTDISLGTGLSMSGSTLNIIFPTAGNTQFGVVKFDALGDLTETALNSGIAVVKALAITNSKLSDMSAVSQLKGSSSSSSAVTDISLGTGLSMSGSTLNMVTIASSLVQFTGGITYPTITGIGSTTMTFTSFSAYVRYTNLGNDIREIWTYPGGIYNPIWANGASQQATYVAFVPDYTTINTTKSLKIVEYVLYRNFPTNEAAEIVFYTIATRDTGTTLFTSFVSYMEGYYGTEYGEKIQIFYSGSVSLNPLSYRLTPESSNFGAVIGSYFRLASGSAKVAGRNYLNDIFSTYVITADPFVQGASSNMTVTVAGRGTIGNEGQQFFRTTGVTAKILGSSTSIIFEPINANSILDYVVVAPTKWTYYKLVVLPGSRIIIVQPHNQGAFNSSATAVATQHIYDTTPYNTYDRWIPTIFVGYMALNGLFNLNVNWAANAGLYAFYDVNKVQYA